MHFTVTVRAESQSIFGRILTTFGQWCPMVNFKKWSSTGPSHERSALRAPFAISVGTVQPPPRAIVCPRLFMQLAIQFFTFNATNGRARCLDVKTGGIQGLPFLQRANTGRGHKMPILWRVVRTIHPVGTRTETSIHSCGCWRIQSVSTSHRHSSESRASQRVRRTAECWEACLRAIDHARPLAE